MILTFLLDFSWKELFLGTEDWGFLLEIVLRTMIMFLTIIIALRVLGKRGVKQLSVFELVVIIGLGSAAGDPMFYKEVGVVSSMVVFIIIILLYSLLTHSIGRFKKIENLLEGKAICLIEDGIFAIDNFKKENLGSDEFFAELRGKGISHLGQINWAIEEVSGEISVFYHEDENVKYGLPIMLHSLEYPLTYIDKADHYSCTFCGYTEFKNPGPAEKCINCKREHWIQASIAKRIT
ncbi:DUF421 domain-containing protein [Chryseobacterium sp. GMJ5]|uniref:DUF421 domain-containing protein n=1 Tax=Chryseobacterium gilvum TaxID=2976534 RepID=A0ABT2VU41_9FLAO|nr:YetF domain-containing protein [Chryseobacterium gilvum]MCU7613516.1 DUF421 domain-containing protein [Chryseobacterium gilvum]